MLENKININKPGKSSIVGIMVRVGARDENEQEKGISHFIEHLCFKGNHKRNCREIAAAIENCGGDLNAFTDSEITCYWAKVANRYLKEATDVIVDLVTDPLFPTKEIEKEREVILQEIKIYEDDPKDYVWELFNRVYFKQNSSLYTPTCGTVDVLKAIHRPEMLKYYKEYYRNLTLITIGDVKTTKSKRFNDDYSYKSEALQYTNQTTGEKIVTKEDISQANILVGGYSNKIVNRVDDTLSLELLGAIYNDMSGRLFTEIREKHNLCYGVRFGSQTFNDGLILWAVNLGLEKSKIKFAHDKIVQELTRPFTKKEIELGLQKVIGDHELKSDNLNHLFATVAYSERKYIEYAHFVQNFPKEIESISKNINLFAERLDFKKNLLVGVVPK